MRIQLGKSGLRVILGLALIGWTNTAAAYAENGDFQTARSWSQKCIAVADESVIEQARKELASYQQNKPWRESEIPPENKPKAD